MEKRGRDEMPGKIADSGRHSAVTAFETMRARRTGRERQPPGRFRRIIEGGGGQPPEFAILSLFRRDG